MMVDGGPQRSALFQALRSSFVVVACMSTLLAHHASAQQPAFETTFGALPAGGFFSRSGDPVTLEEQASAAALSLVTQALALTARSGGSTPAELLGEAIPSQTAMDGIVPLCSVIAATAGEACMVPGFMYTLIEDANAYSVQAPKAPTLALTVEPINIQATSALVDLIFDDSRPDVHESLRVVVFDGICEYPCRSQTQLDASSLDTDRNLVTANLQNLVPGNMHQLVIESTSSDAFYVTEKAIQTPLLPPVEHVTLIAAVALAFDNMTLTLKVPLSCGPSRITSYELKWVGSCTSGSLALPLGQNELETCRGQAAEVVYLPLLPNDCCFNLTTWGINSGGRGPASSAPFCSPLDPRLASSITAELVTNTSTFRVSWTVPELDFGMLDDLDFWQVAVGEPGTTPSVVSTRSGIASRLFVDVPFGAVAELGLSGMSVQFAVRRVRGEVVGNYAFSDLLFVPFQDEQREETTDSASNGGLVAGTVIATCAALALCAVIVAMYFRQRQRTQLEEVEIPEPDKWEVSTVKLVPGKEIGRGAFGTVRRGIARDLSEDLRGEIPVAIKQCNRRNLSAEALNAFLAEMSLMKFVSSPGHDNVVKLLGVVTETRPLTLVVEYAAYGDLRNFLMEARPDFAGGHAKLSAADLMQFSIDIAQGMKYLASRGCVHRDLSARNCLVFDDNKVKVADFGLSRRVELMAGYYRKNGEDSLPFRWLAPECIMDGIWSQDSDVWSYGITLWEIWTFGHVPYPGWAAAHVCREVVNGYRLPPPHGTPAGVADIMHRCWDRARPTFAQLTEQLQLIATDPDNLLPSDLHGGSSSGGGADSRTAETIFQDNMDGLRERQQNGGNGPQQQQQQPQLSFQNGVDGEGNAGVADAGHSAASTPVGSHPLHAVSARGSDADLAGDGAAKEHERRSSEGMRRLSGGIAPTTATPSTSPGRPLGEQREAVDSSHRSRGVSDGSARKPMQSQITGEELNHYHRLRVGRNAPHPGTSSNSVDFSVTPDPPAAGATASGRARHSTDGQGLLPRMRARTEPSPIKPSMLSMWESSQSHVPNGGDMGTSLSVSGRDQQGASSAVSGASSGPRARADSRGAGRPVSPPRMIDSPTSGVADNVQTSFSAFPGSHSQTFSVSPSSVPPSGGPSPGRGSITRSPGLAHMSGSRSLGRDGTRRSVGFASSTTGNRNTTPPSVVLDGDLERSAVV